MLWSLVFKHFFIFVLGMCFATIIISVVSAYYMYKSRKAILNEGVQFQEDSKSGLIYWDNLHSIKSALDAWYTILYRQITGSNRNISYCCDRRASRLFMLMPVSLIVVMLAAIWLSFSIQLIN